VGRVTALRARTAAVLAVSTIALMVGCASPPSSEPTAPGNAVTATATEALGSAPVTSVQVGGETVYVTEYDVSEVTYSSLDQFVDQSPVIVEGVIIATNDLAAEKVPSATEEGTVPGEGADIYSSFTFRVTSVLKGAPDLTAVQVAFPSGKRDGRDRNARIAYKREGLSEVQQPDGTKLEPVDTLKQKKFLMFAAPNNGIYPVPGTTYVLAHPRGIARVAADGRLKFGGRGEPPIDRRSGVTVDDVRAAVTN